MTPKQIAHDIIEQENVYLAQAYQLAEAYLALESRIAKLEAVAEAAMHMRIYCLGSDSSTQIMLKKFDAAIAELRQE